MIHVLCVTDTNVWLDLGAGDVLDACFGFDAQWTSTDLVLAETPMAALRERLLGLGLAVRSLRIDELDEVTA